MDKNRLFESSGVNRGMNVLLANDILKTSQNRRGDRVLELLLQDPQILQRHEFRLRTGVAR
jgi:hypothetical protein